MQRAYYTTHNFIRHSGNIVDLGAYRQRLERVTAPVTEPSLPEADQPRTFPRVRRRGAAYSGLFLDYCASAAIVAMTITVIVRFLVA